MEHFWYIEFVKRVIKAYPLMSLSNFRCLHLLSLPGVSLMVRVVGLESSDPELKSHSVVELIPGGVDFACHPSEVGKLSASLLVSCIGVATRPGLCPIAKETA